MASGAPAHAQSSSFVLNAVLIGARWRCTRATAAGYAVAIYLAACSLITIVAVASYAETRHRDLSADDALSTADVIT